MSNKTCRKCLVEKPLTEFHRDKAKKDGHRGVCKPCDHLAHAGYVQGNRQAVLEYRRQWHRENPSKAADYGRARRLRCRATYLVRNAKDRSLANGLPFDLDRHVQEIQTRIDRGRCELTGLPFRLTGRRTWDSPSLDRICPKDGYLYRNVRVVCRAINCALGDWGEEVLAAVVKSWLARRG